MQLRPVIKIHYIWFKDYYTFHNQGINFSNKYVFSYDPKIGEYGELSLKKGNDGYIENFFGKNIDLTAIVGQNGTGKTTLLRFFLKLSSGDVIDTDCVIVCEKDSKFWGARYFIKNNKAQCAPLNIIGINNLIYKPSPHEQQRFPFRSDIRFVYLTEMFNMSQYSSEIAGTDDLSFASVLYEQTEYGDQEKHLDNPILRYIHRLNDWQLEFISNGRKYVEKFNINYPKSVTISLSYDKMAFSNLYIRLNCKDEEILSEGQKGVLIEEARNYLNTFLNIDKSVNRTLKDEYAIAILMNVISSLHFVISYTKDEGKVLMDLIDQIYQNKYTYNAWDTVFTLLKLIEQKNKNHTKRYVYSRHDTIEFSDSISINAEKYMMFMEYFDSFLSDYSEYQINSENYSISIPTDKMNIIQDFINAYKKSVRLVDFLTFSWGLSSGENLLLNQFGKIMHILNKKSNGKYYLPVDENNIDKKATNAVILLDEAEVAFHPEWQRIYLESFLKYLKGNISNQGTHVQIVLATHSPIILSDIPKQNTVFIKKDKTTKQSYVVDSKETFASNIFSLYQNAFFLDESGIGAFAENKLCELVRKIHNLYRKEQNDNSTKKAKDIIRNEIKCIGDPYIRNKFEKELYYIVDLHESNQTE